MTPPDPQQISSSLFCLPSVYLNYNSGVICRADEAWLIDPGISPEEVGRIRVFVKDRGCRVTAVVLTHFHWDHIMGVNAFPDVRVIAGRWFPREFQAHEPGNSRAIESWLADEKCGKAAWSYLPQPSEFIGRARSLRLADLEVSFLPIAGHTADQIGVYLPAEKAFWAADSLSDLEIPFNSYSCKATIGSLANLRKVSIEKLVPGHGNPAMTEADVRERLERDLRYERKLQSLIRTALNSGCTLEETKALAGQIEIHHPEDNEGGHLWNIESAYKEYGGKVERLKVGWQQELG